MFGFGRKKRREEQVAQTFVEATGGGWSDSPETVAMDGGGQRDYVSEMLRRASVYARENVEVGEEFAFTITDIPAGIASPHEIVIGLMMQADEYGLQAGVLVNETAHFTRVK